MSKQVLDAVGFLDENFTPAFYEDVDYMARDGWQDINVMWRIKLSFSIIIIKLQAEWKNVRR